MFTCLTTKADLDRQRLVSLTTPFISKHFHIFSELWEVVTDQELLGLYNSNIIISRPIRGQQSKGHVAASLTCLNC